MEVLLFTDVARGYCYNNQASRNRNKERPPEPAKPSLSSSFAGGEVGVWGESFRRERFEGGRRCLPLCMVQVLACL